MGVVARHVTYANVASTLALVVALGGAGYALTVTSADIRDDTIRQKDLAFYSLEPRDLLLKSTERAKAVTVTPDEAGFVDLGSVAVTLRRTQNVTMSAFVNWAYGGSGDATLVYRVLLDGKPHHEHRWRQTVVGADAADWPIYGVSAVSVLCNAVPAGQHVLTLQARAEQGEASVGAGVTFERRVLNVVGFPGIFSPPARDEY